MPPPPDYRLCVAPMMDWTDRHCRAVHRLLAPRATLFTEMIAVGAILHGDRDRFLAHDQADKPVILQLGGSEPDDLATAVRLAEPYDYAGYDLNCGCPSARVQKGGFGASLMLEPERVGDCIAAMIAATDRPVSVKCRLGVDDGDTGPFLDRFIDTVADAGCRTFTLHARKAWLSGLSPKENRDIPPLDYDRVTVLKARRPDLRVILNGGLTDASQAEKALHGLDGVMIGREAYQNPLSLPRFEAALFGLPQPDRATMFRRAVDGITAYLEQLDVSGTPPAAVLRHVLGLANGQPGARRYRRILSEGMRSDIRGPALWQEALGALATPGGRRQAA